MSTVRKQLRKILPQFILAWHWKYFKARVDRFQDKTTDEVFSEIYRVKYWGDNESISGVGSSLDETRSLSQRLPQLFSDYKIQSMLDIPCGDFYWMQHVDLSSLKYIGADIVQQLAVENNRKYQKPNITFTKLDLTSDPLPQVDLIFCRDCLIHLAEDKVFAALKNIRRSNSKYLLTTTHIDSTSNKKIITGDWRPINLEIAPFNLPKPLLYISDFKMKSMKDKTMALWRIGDLPV
jgi:hypothetical protein